MIGRLFLCLACLAVLPAALHGQDRLEAIEEAMRTVFQQPDISCPGCSQLKSGEKSEVTDSELAVLRVEFVKQQILKKLKLKEVPKVSVPKNILPKPIQMQAPQNTIEKKPEDLDLEDDGFFGKTNQVVLLPENIYECDEKFKNLAACFSFRLPKDLEMDDIAVAELWVYKKMDFLDSKPFFNQTFVYSEVVNNHGNYQVDTFRRHVTKVKEGWIKLDVLETVLKWPRLNKRHHTIQVRCETCGYPTPWLPISIDNDQPFMVFKTEANKKKKRPKRNVNCMVGVSECCRDKLYISFKDIGWEFVTGPTGFDAYFCRGSCSNAVSLTLSSSAYTSVLRKVYNSKNVTLVPCCAATHMSSLEITYMTDNVTATRKKLPNMIVEACGCL